MAAELIKEFESQISAFTLVPSSGGRFELSIDGKLVYSKLKTNRHPEPGEMARLVKEKLQEKL